MKKNISWQVLILIGLVGAFAGYFIGGVIGNAIGVFGDICFLIGVVNMIVAWTKNRKTKNINQEVIVEKFEKEKKEDNNSRELDKVIKIGIIVGALAVVLSAVYYFSVFLPAQQKQKLSEQQSTENQIRDVDLQVKCAQQAKIFYDYFESGPEPKNQKDYYENHFNLKLNKCFILMHQFPDEGGLASDFLFDAIEKKEYAEFMYSGSIAKKDYCVFVIENSKCESRIEFNDFVNKYMND